MHRTHGVLELQRAGGHQRGVLTEAVAREIRHRRQLVAEHLEGRVAGGQDRRLLVGGELQLLLRTVETERTDCVAQCAVRGLEHLARRRQVRPILSHADALGALPRKDDGDTHR